jgi:hypothetical protein
MVSLKDTAKDFQPKQTKNIADLEVVSLDYPVEKRTGKDKDNKEFEYNVIIFMGQEYRIPDSVLRDIKAINEAKPTLKTVKVIKKGTGLNTSYTVIPIE